MFFQACFSCMYGYGCNMYGWMYGCLRVHMNMNSAEDDSKGEAVGNFNFCSVFVLRYLRKSTVNIIELLYLSLVLVPVHV